ncbi:hypothetical protein HC928_04395 [bacterium]|nr:hypothetical protein [bacterium]
MNHLKLAERLTAQFAYRRSVLRVQAAKTAVGLEQLNCQLAQSNKQLAIIHCHQEQVAFMLEISEAQPTTLHPFQSGGITL